MEKDNTKNHITVGKLLEILIGVILLVMVIVFAALCTKANTKVNSLETEVSQLKTDNMELKSTIDKFEQRENEIKGIVSPDGN